LNVLQDKKIERVGGIKTIPLDIRIIAATNRNLDDMVKSGQFRADLLFRLNVFPIWIPPLRDRTVDIPTLVQHFINLKSRELKLNVIPHVYPGEMDILLNYHWPGNVRELQNVIERALILNPSGPLKFENLNTEQPNPGISDKHISGEILPLEDMIRHHVTEALALTKGKVHGKDGAAALLNINASTLRNRMNKLGIQYGKNIK
jgi:transcriptional regulator with PAS, ATPase and Fis domain